MNRLVNQLHKSFELMPIRNWEKIFVAVDVHDTVMESTYSDILSFKYYPDALETLKLMSDDKEICLILWTSSKIEHQQEYSDALKNEGINMNYINSNPEVGLKHYADYSSKFYMNLILDDKAGFLPSYDWAPLKSYMQIRKFFKKNIVTKDFLLDFVKNS